MKTYHISPKSGWMNDPNGLVWFKGKYHCFFQYYPTLPAQNDKWWGHFVSNDLLEWEELSPAIEPNGKEDSRGVWSGSAIEKDGILYCFYTGIRDEGKNTPTYAEELGSFGVCLATSEDGVNFKKYSKNPIIPHFPESAGNKFRDPSVFFTKGSYYMVLAGYNSALYHSTDLLNWEYVGIPLDTGSIECPDFRPFADKYLFMFSQGKKEWGKETVKFVYGDFDGNKFLPLSISFPELGPHFYAPQTMIDHKKRTLLFAWMFAIVDGQIIGNGRIKHPGTDGMLTIPHELFLKNGKVYAFPPVEYQHLLKDSDPDVLVTETDVTLAVPWDKPLVYHAEHIYDVKIFRESNALEVFINGGEAVFTYLY